MQLETAAVGVAGAAEEEATEAVAGAVEEAVAGAVVEAATEAVVEAATEAVTGVVTGTGAAAMERQMAGAKEWGMG